MYDELIPLINQIVRQIEKDPDLPLDKRGIVVYLPTGGGKTILASVVLRWFMDTLSRQAMMMAHRKELVLQTDDKYKRVYPDHIASDIIKAGIDRTYASPLKIASVQTLSRRLRKGDEQYMNPNLIIVDEGHHATAETYLDVLMAYQSCNIILTATPCKMDGTGFEDIASYMVKGPSVKQLEKLWMESEHKDRGLVPDKYFHSMLTLQINNVKKTKGDFDTKQLNKLLNQDNTCQAIVDEYKDKFYDWDEWPKTIAFTCRKSRDFDESQAQRLTRIFNQNGIPAFYVDSKTPAGERDALLRDFASGKYRVFCNCEIATEGFDVPDIDCTLLCRPTHSLGLYIQMGGRGKRPAGPNKERHYIFDMVGNSMRHGMLNAEHNWTIKGVQKAEPKYGLKLIKIGDKLFDFDDLGDAMEDIEGMVSFEVVDNDEAMRRVMLYTVPFEKFKRMSRFTVRQASWRAYVEFVKGVEANPSEIELKLIQQWAGYAPNWVKYQHRNFSKANDLCKAITDYESYGVAWNYIDDTFRFRPKDGQQKGNPAPGHEILIKRAEKSYMETEHYKQNYGQQQAATKEVDLSIEDSDVPF